MADKPNTEDGNTGHLPETLTSYQLDWNDRGASLTVPTEHYYRGFTMGDWWEVRVPAGFEEVSDWSNGYRSVHVNRAQRAIFTYCEGDLDLTIDDTEEQFQARLASAAQFYSEVA